MAKLVLFADSSSIVVVSAGEKQEEEAVERKRELGQEFVVLAGCKESREGLLLSDWCVAEET